jgi:hypothetical protein
VPIIGLPGGPNDTPVPWVTPGDLTCELEEAAATSAIAAATEIFYVLSGRIFGLRQRTYRPNVCQSSCGCSAEWGQWGEAPEWSSVGASCGCSNTDLRLPLVNSVDAVFVDGVTLAVDAYELYDRYKLVRVDGGTWGCCQQLSVNPYALAVVATAGTPVPEMGKLAVIEMACQIGAIGTSSCKLPQRVQTISRQGMTWTVLDPQDFLNEGRTGLYFGDLFLAAVNPAKLRAPVRVMSPDTPRISIQT